MFTSKHKIHLSPKLKLGVRRGFNKNHILKLSGSLFLIIALGFAGNALKLFVRADSSPAASPQVLGVSDVNAAETAEDQQFLEVKVQQGDTLFNLSQKHHISWTTLATLNNLKSPFTLKPGQIIKVPKE